MSFLIVLIFLSKVSLAFLPGVPYQIFPVIYQYGLHPYINLFLNIFLGCVLIVKFLLNPKINYKQNRFYKLFIVLISTYLILVSSLQIIFNVNQGSDLFLIVSCGLSLFTIYFFGRIIPLNFPEIEFVKIVRTVCIAACWVSLILLVVSPSTSFKGGRFIGVFKHIPHMVSVATVAAIFIFEVLFQKNLRRLHKIFYWASFLCAFFLLILTGTRSALAAVLLSLGLCIFVYPAKNAAIQWLKGSIAVSGFLILLFFGSQIIDYTVEVVRGEEAIGLRQAQDGIAARWDEIERGLQTFQEQPLIGHGLLHKFNQANDDIVGSYNANKDPHNLLISAGVIGGWGFMILIGVGFVFLSVLTIKKLFFEKRPTKILAIYLLTHLPILFIYHMHLSTGGIADRIYWIVMGYMAIQYPYKYGTESKNDNVS